MDENGVHLKGVIFGAGGGRHVTRGPCCVWRGSDGPWTATWERRCISFILYYIRQFCSVSEEKLPRLMMPDRPETGYFCEVSPSRS